MSAPSYSSADFLRAMQALMPRGRVWPKDQDAVQTQVLSGISQSFARHTERSNYLLVDAFPGTSVELLPEWEATLGLPDPCAGPAPTVASRQAQVVARLAGGGGQSTQFFIRYAELLGYTITITEFAPARVGVSRVGLPLNGVDWAFAWKINAPLETVAQSRVGTARAGEPLASWGNAVLECELLSRVPAHTIPIFAYT